MTHFLDSILAFQLADAAGWVGQGLFTARMLVQWIASERAGKSVLPSSFWVLSLGGTAFLLIYQWHRADIVFFGGVFVHMAIYCRNVFLRPDVNAPPARLRKIVLVAALGLAAFAFLMVGQASRFAYEGSFVWLVEGTLAQSMWTARFVAQWWASERLHRSHLPPSFFWLGILGCSGLFAYAVYRIDWVMMAAYGPNVVPYARNLVLLRRHAPRAPA